MMAFLLLSEALTGVHADKLWRPNSSRPKSEILNSDPGVDPINIKNAYFDWIKAMIRRRHSANCCKSPRIIASRQADIVPKVNGSDDDTKFLARSIVLLWYLGSWYKPDDLKKKSRLARAFSHLSRFAEGLHAGIGLANRWRPPNGLQQFAVRLLVTRSARSESFRASSTQRSSEGASHGRHLASPAMSRSSGPDLPDL